MTAVPVTADRTKFLRTVLVLDAAVTGANGLAYLVAAPLLSELLGPETGLLRALGAFLLAYGAAVAVLGTRREISPAGTKAVIGVNIVWTLASVAAVAFGMLAFTTMGAVWGIVQALTVGALAELQIMGLRKARRQV
ncbi:hypothetical protein ACIBEJ_50120 [Nonomuraea sp. NPDC050790]|uniref:hypothetical protein n=1 Tax=Nonomuraea sp. NPDC050790 TaxID=3364371 RepID=UPI0037B9ACCA